MKLPAIAQAASSIFDFMIRQNPKRHLLNTGDLKVWHKKLFESVVPVPYYAGNFRAPDRNRPCLDVDVFVGTGRGGANSGSPAASVEADIAAMFEELTRACIATDEVFAKSSNSVSHLKSSLHLAAFGGGAIIRIHPFVNGNGRIARMVMNFFLHRYFNTVPFYIDRPSHPDYSTASEIAMRTGNYIPLYQYLVELIATKT